MTVEVMVSSPFDRPKCSEARVLVKQFDLSEANCSQQVQLIRDGARRVFGDDAFVQFLPKRIATGCRQVLAKSPPVDGLNFGKWAFNNVVNPKCTKYAEIYIIFKY